MKNSNSVYAFLNRVEPLVSVVIPVFNVRPYLSQCIESVLQQTYNNLEIILVDDGSTDGCGEICDLYAKKDCRIHVLHTKNNGLASARNTGLSHIKGDYLSFVDSDDWIEPNAIRSLLETIINDGADLAVALIIKEYVNTTILPPKPTYQHQVYHGNKILEAYVKGTFNNVVWNKLYRKSCFDKVEFPEGHNYEDVSVTWRIMRNLAEDNKTVSLLSKELFHFRMRESSISNSRYGPPHNGFLFRERGTSIIEECSLPGRVL